MSNPRGSFPPAMALFSRMHLDRIDARRCVRGDNPEFRVLGRQWVAADMHAGVLGARNVH
jgi:hypothetical protein